LSNSGAKRCPGCQTEKPHSDFGTNKRLSDGLAYYCKACFQAISRASYRKRQAERGKAVRNPRAPAPPGSKWCNDCHDYRPLAEFPRNVARFDGFMTYCRMHHNKRVVESRELVHGSSRHYHLVRRYGIGAAEVEAMISRQAGACLICLRSLGDKAHVDHDHETGAVRGMLCFNCNGGLGQFGDDPDLLRRAAEYLDDHVSALGGDDLVGWPSIARSWRNPTERLRLLFPPRRAG
jgi:Recombination endonuclease VII